jgi:predicted aldo/keto reductase-like oxidoreductase
VSLPAAAAKVLDDLQGGSHASYAIRFAAGQEGVMMVLSGMGSMDMVNDNISYMQDFQPLSEKEQAAIEQVRAIFASFDTIACTDCRYCMEECPKKIPIPKFFAMINSKKVWGTWEKEYAKELVNAPGQGPDGCMRCGDCEAACPQHLPIRRLLQTVREELVG